MPTTDIHNHVIPKAVLDLVVNDSAYGVKVTDGVWTSTNQGPFPLVDAWHSVDAKLREMDEKELDRAVLSVAPKPLFFYDLPLDKQQKVAEVANAAMAEFCAGHEDRLRWMAHVPLGFPETAAEVLTAAVDAGACGVELGTSARGRMMDDPAYEVLWDTIGPLDLPVFLHPAYESSEPRTQGLGLDGVLGLPYEITNALQRLIAGGILTHHKRVKIVAALGGGYFPYIAGRLRHYSSFVAELAGAPADPWGFVGQIKFDSHLHDPEILRFLIERAGTENVLIGSDCSFLSASPHPVGELREALQGDQQAFVAISDTNAEPFWGYAR
ncbi:MAG TPA: amidohydrolase family protein [Pseudolysinimonas sp.]|jgi:aminocarboxymuconate-semialdehyde decarboxylase